MSRFLYTLSLWLLLPWVVLHLLWRSRRQPEYRRHWNERFGFYTTVTPSGDFMPPIPAAGHFIPEGFPAAIPTFWLHAVSVGETRAAQPLIAAIRRRYPDHRILLTHMTPTGRQTSAALFGHADSGVERIYLPYDYPFAVRRFLDHYQPVMGLIMETELWPNLIAACGQRAIPLALVNARLSEKSARRYARFPELTRGALRGLVAIAAQNEADAQRLRVLGAPRVEVLGNVKFDIEPPPAQLELAADFRRRCGTRPIFLAASTREGEEALLLDAWQKVGGSDTALLVIVPRHPQRFAEVAALIEARGLSLQRRSDDANVASATQVWLGDSMGEMFAWHAAADVAFIGGSLLDFGSQNLIEACAVGTPVLLGPLTYNFAAAAQDAIACGGARQVQDAAELVATARQLLSVPEERKRMSAAGLAFASRHRGATRRTLTLIERYIPVPS